MNEVLVCGQQRQTVSNAELREKRVYRSHLDAGSAATIAEISSLDVVLAIGRKQWKRTESIDDLCSITRA